MVKFTFQKLISVLTNPWTYYFFYRRIIDWLFPTLNPQIKINKPALDFPVVTLEGQQCSLLKDYVNRVPKGVPIILNFGSYNWGLFLEKLDEMGELYKTFCSGPKPLAEFLTVYIVEGIILFIY